jgi:hypothetical protein
MSEQEVCSLGIRDCRGCCHPPKEELIAAKAEGHWGRRKYGSGRWEELDGDPVGLENGFIYKFFPNFVPAVATHTDEEILNYKIENQRLELNRINIQLHRTLVKMDEANSYINKLQDEVSEAKESTQPTTATSLIVELECMRGSNSYSEYPKIWEDGFNYCKSSAIWRAKSHALVEENAIRKDEQKRLANLFNRRYIDPLVEDFIRNGGSK